MFTTSLLLALSLSIAPTQDGDGDKNKTAATNTTEETKMVKVDGKMYKPNAKVCKRFATTGTRVKTRKCMTAKAWAYLEERSEELGRDMQSTIDSNNRGG